MRTSEQHIQALDSVEQDSGSPTTIAAIEAGADAIAFSQSLWDLFGDQGSVDKNADIDYGKLENLIDGIHGELAAACVFLSEDAFEKVPDMLRLIAAAVERDPSKSVPKVVIEGYRRLATRIEATRTNIRTAKKILLDQEQNSVDSTPAT